MQGIGGSLVASRPILERGGYVVCMVEKEVVAGPTADTAVRECAPSLWRSTGGSVASAR